ncbi:MAG TPA: secretin N-terminal domain-containing protein [Verrucomicrobiota bacterium]|nr:secretin N-terminal domain-containing protein [Verrucomicrobiota bacterium]
MNHPRSGPIAWVIAVIVAAGFAALSAVAQVPPAPPGAPASASAATNAPTPLNPNEEIQVSFQGANVDMIVQWLSETTGKSVVKHPQAQCQITITSSKKLPVRDALNLVYRALGLEGFTAVESGNSIFIVPEGKEPKMSPELIDASRSDIPAGRQKLVKIFQLKSVPAAEMKEKVKGALSEKATVEINDRANQIIITDYNENVSLIANLIDRLDTDQPGDLTVRVIPLQHASARDLVKEITPLYQKMSGKPAGEPVEVSANERSNSLIVLSSESNFRSLERIVRTLDTIDAQEKTMRLFPLKNADAEDVARQLKELSTDQASSSRSRYFYYGPEPEKSVGKMTVVADRRRNTVIVQAPPAQMEGIAKTIAALDEPVGGEGLAPRIYPLKYVSAVDIEDILNELFLKKQQPRSYYFFDDPPEPTADRDVGRLYGKVRITSEPYSNSIILTANSQENLEAVEEVLKQLDVPSSNGESTFRVGLKYAKAITIANSLNILFAKGGSPALRPVNQPNQQAQQQQLQNNQQNATQSQNSTPLERETKDDLYFPWIGGQPENLRSGDGKSATRQVSDLVGRVRVVPDHRSNSVLISANVHLFPQVVKLIQELDAPTAQVLIEARIVEVSSDQMDRFGVRWSPDGSKTFTADDYDNSIIGKGRMNYLQGFGGDANVNNADRTGITSLRSGVLDVSVNLDVLIQFLKKTTDASVLAEPQISIEDNEAGKLFVGQQVPFIYSSQNTEAGSLNQSFTYKDVGVILEVIPHINVTGDVLLRIRVESSTIVPGVTILGGAVIDARTFRTDMTAKTGETIVLGGIIQKQFSETIRKVPFLGDIPGLGWAFKKKDKTSRNVELFVFLRPRVIRTPQDAVNAAKEIEIKTPLIQDWMRQADSLQSTNVIKHP